MNQLNEFKLIPHQIQYLLIHCCSMKGNSQPSGHKITRSSTTITNESEDNLVPFQEVKRANNHSAIRTLASLFNNNIKLSMFTSLHNLTINISNFKKKRVALQYLNLIFRKKKLRHFGSALSALEVNSKKKDMMRKQVMKLGMCLKASLRRRVEIAFNILSHSIKTGKEGTRNEKQGNSLLSKGVNSPRNTRTEQPSLNLSEQVTQALKKMQRFDRFVYAQNSEKMLTEPVEKELRRIQRLKNGRKDLRDTYFDNELTITCLFNHVKLIGELNRQINSFANIKLQKEEVENKVIQMNMELKKEMKEKEVKSKENSKFMEILISGLQDAPEKGKKLIESHTRHLDGDKKVLGNLILSLVTKLNDKPNEKVVEKTVSQDCERVLLTHLNSLYDSTPSLDKKIASLQKQKNLFEQKVTESQSAHMKETYETLWNTWDSLIKLHSEIKQKTTDTISKPFISERKLLITKQTPSEGLTDEILTTPEIQKICNNLNQGEDWINDLEILKSKYTRKGVHLKNPQTKNLFTLINQLIKNTKDVRTLRDIVISKEEKLKQVEETTKPEKEKSLLRVKSMDKFQRLDPIKQEMQQLIRLSESIESILEKKQSEGKFQILKLKKLLGDKKRYNEMVSVVTLCEKLALMVIGKEEQERRRAGEESRGKQVLGRELGLLGSMLEKLEGIVEVEKMVQGNSQIVMKVRKSLQQIDGKMAKLQQSVVDEQWGGILAYIISGYNKLIGVIEALKESTQVVSTLPVSPRNGSSIISKQEHTNVKHQLQQAKKVIKDMESQNYKLELENQKLKEKGETVSSDIQERRKSKIEINKLNRIIQDHLKKQRQNQEQIKLAYNEIQQLKVSSLAVSTNEISSQREISQAKSDMRKKEQEIKQMTREFKKKEDELNRCVREKESQYWNQVSKNQKLQGSMADLIESLKANSGKGEVTVDHKELLTEINRLKQEINMLNGAVDTNKKQNEQMMSSITYKHQEQTSLFQEQIHQLNTKLQDIKQSSHPSPSPSISIFPQQLKDLQATNTQLQEKIALLTDQNSNYLQTIQRLSQKIYQKQIQNNQLSNLYYSQLSEIIESCKQCIKLILILQEKQSLQPLRQTLESIITKVSKYIKENQKKSNRNEAEKIDTKKISEINYEQPENIYLDQIQYFGNHPSISYLTNQDQGKFLSRIQFLEKQREYLYKRIKILSVFVSIDLPEKAFIHNLNCVIDRVFSFLLQGDHFKALRIDYNYFMSFVEEISTNVNEENFINYFRAVEDFFKQLLEYVYVEGSGNDKVVGERRMYRGSSVKSDLSEQYQGRYQLSMHSDIRYQKGKYKPSTLQNLLNEYLNSKNAKVLTKIQEVLNTSAQLQFIK